MTGVEIVVVFCLLSIIAFAWNVLADMGHVDVPEVPVFETIEELI